MKMNNKIMAMVGTVVLAVTLGLTGCSSVTEKADDKTTVARYVELPNGGEVLCVFWIPSGSGVNYPDGAQLSCNWAEAKGE